MQNPNLDASVAAPEPGSFRDPLGRVYRLADGRILRGLSRDAAQSCTELLDEQFIKDLISAGKVVGTSLPLAPAQKQLAAAGWHASVEHERVEFISYPYEWTFSMLRDAAVLHLDLLEQAWNHGWTMQDATPYNIQWRGAKPVFIDLLSYARRQEGEAWKAYRQFCMLFLYPLMIRSHLGIDFNSLLRAEINGISPVQAARYFRSWRALFPSVIAHVLFPAGVENAVARRERSNLLAKRPAMRPQSTAMVLGLVQGVKRTVAKLRLPSKQSNWSDYTQVHSYSQDDFSAKLDFVSSIAAARTRKLVWDLGANTGEFAKACAQHADLVVAMDSDHACAERLYQSEHRGNILPLVMNVANPSPAQGWAGAERAALDKRGQPQLVLCLALIHHLRISAGIPLDQQIDWLRSLDSEIIIEFVSCEDEMVKKLLANRSGPPPDYLQDNFEKLIGGCFTTAATCELKGGKRKLYHLIPAG